MKTITNASIALLLLLAFSVSAQQTVPDKNFAISINNQLYNTNDSISKEEILKISFAQTQIFNGSDRTKQMLQYFQYTISIPTLNGVWKGGSMFPDNQKKFLDLIPKMAEGDAVILDSFRGESADAAMPKQIVLYIK